MKKRCGLFLGLLVVKMSLFCMDRGDCLNVHPLQCIPPETASFLDGLFVFKLVTHLTQKFTNALT
jgi:hypothetical protein